MEPRPEAGAVPTHLDLLALAREVRQALVGDDTEQMHAALAHLRAAVAEHLDDEHARMQIPSVLLDAVVTKGQQRILDLLDGVLHTVDDDAASCNCLLRGAEIEIALGRQARLETRIRRRRAGLA